jgi:hypothetical protein
MFFFLSFMIFFNKIKEQEGKTGSAQRQGAGGRANNVYTCK